MQTLKRILLLLEKILEQLDLLSLPHKEILTLKEACIYMGISESHMYKLTSSGTLGCYRPNGKKLYFYKSELNDWLTKNRLETKEYISQQTSNYILTKKLSL